MLLIASSWLLVVCTLAGQPTGVISGTNTICSGESAVINIDVTGTSPWTGTLSDGTSFNGTSSPISVTVNPSSETTYTISTLSDNSGPADPGGLTGSALITVNPIPSTPTASGNSPICAGLTLNLAASDISGATYSWTGPNGFISTSQNPSIPNATTAASGTYSVTATVNGCTSSAGTTKVIVNISPPAPIATSNSPVCAGSDLNLNASNVAGAGYLWTGPDGFTSGVRNPVIKKATTAASGTYSVTATVKGCTSDAGTTDVIVNAVPAIPTVGTITQPDCDVSTGSVVLSGLPAGSWTINPGAISGSGETTTIPGLNAGTYTFTVTNASGCTSLASTKVTINKPLAMPVAPTIGLITQPTCNLSTASVTLSGLPSTGTWIITISPGETTTTGSGKTITIAGLLAGTTYTFKVTNSLGCTSPSSANAVILAQPSVPAAPLVGTITPPTCTVTTGSVVLNGLPASGIWTLIRYPGTVQTTGTGTSATISNLPQGTFNYSITNAAGCVSSSLSGDVLIPVHSSIPSAPVVGSITQPTCSVSTGSVVLSGLPGSGNWTVTRNPGGVITSGSGTGIAISGIPSGTYTFSVTTFDGCISLSSVNAVINPPPVIPSAPGVGMIIQPTCALATGSVVLNSLPSGSWTLTRNPGSVTIQGSGTSTNISGLDAGTYSFTITVGNGCPSLPSANVVITAQPPTPGTPVYTLDCTAGFGHAIIEVTSPVGAGFQYSLDAAGYQSDPVFMSVENGNHYLTVRNNAGCTALGSIFPVLCECINYPSVVLGSANGSTCGTSPVTVSGNTFGGSATRVSITDNGAGSVSPNSSNTSPFAFTYTPASGDLDRTVIITVTSDNPLGNPCTLAVATYTLIVNGIPQAPAIGTITHLTCTTATGSIVLNGLPSQGTWTLSRSPGNVITNGTGTSTTVSGLAAGDYTFTVTGNSGCTSLPSAIAVVNPQPPGPSAPVVGTISQPTCALSTGSVELSGLPATGTWTITRSPGGISNTGTGTSAIVSAVPGGTYTFSVTNSSGCTSLNSENVTIFEQPPAATAPLIGAITPPTCTRSTGSVILSDLPVSGTWTLTRYPGSVVTTGTGTTTTISALAEGIYNYVVTNQAGCVSVPSANLVIPQQPATPDIPLVGTILQPTLSVPTGSVELSGLPVSGTWRLTRSPGNVITSGTGNNITVIDLSDGSYTFRVTNSSGCTSAASAEVIISTPGKPVVIITDPPAVCTPVKVDITAPEIKAGSTADLAFTYWTDPEATIPYDSPDSAVSGTYYIKGTNESGFFDIKPVTVIVDQKPVPDAGPDQIIDYQFSTELDASLGENENGVWSLDKGTGVFTNSTDPKTEVGKLSLGDNVFLWIVSKDVCPPDTGKVTVTVRDLIIPTLITPNDDDRNEYFIINGIESLGKTELTIFDRKGTQVFKDSEYDNKWNGTDYNGKPLPDDTYFYLIKTNFGKVLRGYVVIRR